MLLKLFLALNILTAFHNKKKELTKQPNHL